MAAPAGVTLGTTEVIITTSDGLGVVSTKPTSRVGTIEAIGSAVTAWAVGDVVFFNEDSYFAISPDTWAVVNETKIRFSYVAP